MLTAIFGLCTALTYGAADFFAAIASRKIRVIEVTSLASLAGLVVLLLLLPFMGGSFSQSAFFWGHNNRIDIFVDTIAFMCGSYITKSLF